MFYMLGVILEALERGSYDIASVLSPWTTYHDALFPATITRNVFIYIKLNNGDEVFCLARFLLASGHNN